MMNPLSVRFDDARLKVNRAYRHLHEVQTIINTFAQLDFCKVVSDRNANTGYYSLKVTATANLPPELALAVGDTVHNLRSALDYIVTAMVGKEDNRVSFPMDATWDKLEKSSTLKRVVSAVPNFDTLLRDVIKPYETGNYALWALGKIDNVDKHKLLIPRYSISRVTGISFNSEDQTITATNETVFIQNSHVMSMMQGRSPFQITNQGKPAISVVFGEGSYFANKPIVPTLFQLCQVTLEAIEAVECFHFGTGLRHP